MGSLKDEMRGLTEDHKLCEKADDGERPGSSDGSVDPEGPQINTRQESSTQDSYEPKVHKHTSYEDKDLAPEDREESREVCDNIDKDFMQSDPTQELEASEDTQTNPEMFPINGDTPQDKSTSPDRDKAQGIENITIPVPVTPGPCEPCTPAPFGQHHMRTQVSLEVVQCHSAATSPMTPPEGGHSSSFFFPSSFGKCRAAGSDTKDVEMQVGHQVEFCSVATSPMTPKTPSVTAFPLLIGRETIQKKQEEKVEVRVGQKVDGSFPVTERQAKTESEKTEGFDLDMSKMSDASEQCCPAVGSRASQEESKQKRMGSMDQDITILVTHHDNSEEEKEKQESPVGPAETEMIEECVEIDGKMGDEKENIPTGASDDNSNSTKAQSKLAESTIFEARVHVTDDNSEVREVKIGCENVNEVSALKSPIPESPAPFGCHNIRTQVSLDVVQCQSAATSPMTPPEGDQAFSFPTSSMRCGAVSTETKDAEMQVGQQVEYRSVATAPMTPRTPVATSFPEVRKETSLEEKIEEEEEEEKKEEKMIERDCKEKCEEPVQEVSWDEKGMTWEVYGAVVEVTVLGSAIQKHLEKQVKKQRNQPSMHPPPPLNPSAMPMNSGGKGKRRGQDGGETGRRRRNPFRQLMENMQQPHCCSRAHSAE